MNSMLVLESEWIRHCATHIDHVASALASAPYQIRRQSSLSNQSERSDRSYNITNIECIPMSFFDESHIRHSFYGWRASMIGDLASLGTNDHVLVYARVGRHDMGLVSWRQWRNCPLSLFFDLSLSIWCWKRRLSDRHRETPFGSSSHVPASRSVGSLFLLQRISSRWWSTDSKFRIIDSWGCEFLKRSRKGWWRTSPSCWLSHQHAYVILLAVAPHQLI